MGLFNFNKNKTKVETKEEIVNIKKDIPNLEDIGYKEYSLLCINYGINNYCFTLTVNSNGKIIINNSLSKEEYNDLIIINEIAILIEENLKKIKAFSNRNNTNKQDDNMLQFEIEKEKYTLYRNDTLDEESMFYDRFIFELANILNLKKCYENIKLDFTFDYPNNWEEVPTDLNKYCLLSNSVPILVFKDSSQNFITFEYINIRNGIVNNIIENITGSGDYEVLEMFNSKKVEITANYMLVNYKDNNKIELFCFLTLKNICIIITAVIDDKNNIDIEKMKTSKKFGEIIDVIESFKILTSEDINK